MRDYTFKRLTARQLASKRKPLCEFSKGVSNGTQLNLCQEAASYLVYWPDRNGQLCTTPAYGCESCKDKIDKQNGE